ncbi:P-loop containing nucleoside triphosphate hydrolase protein, partial [Usnea florida]
MAWCRNQLICPRQKSQPSPPDNLSMDDAPTITILLLGDPDSGKSTFLSKLSHGTNSTQQQPTIPPALLRDHDQPFIWHIRLYNRFYRFAFYDTACPEPHYTALAPDFVVLCYDIGDRRSLVNVQQVWFRRMVESYMRDREDIPVMLLGLKRDLRREEPGVIYPQEV